MRNVPWVLSTLLESLPTLCSVSSVARKEWRKSYVASHVSSTPNHSSVFYFPFCPPLVLSVVTCVKSSLDLSVPSLHFYCCCPLQQPRSMPAEVMCSWLRTKQPLGMDPLSPPFLCTLVRNMDSWLVSACIPNQAFLLICFPSSCEALAEHCHLCVYLTLNDKQGKRYPVHRSMVKVQKFKNCQEQHMIL